jgi:hypothetical protein
VRYLGRRDILVDMHENVNIVGRLGVGCVDSEGVDLCFYNLIADRSLICNLQSK